MAKRFTRSHLILIRAQVPYKGSWQRVLSQKLEEERTLYALPNNRINSHVHRDPLNEDPYRDSRVAIWFYKGCNARPDVVSTFAYWFELNGFHLAGVVRPDVARIPVLIYFPSEFDWYTQSTSTIAVLSHLSADPRCNGSEPTRVARNLYHDPPGKNVLMLNDVQPVDGHTNSLDLANYVVCRGPRLGMRAREYFVDSKCGQRVACLKYVKSNDPAHLIRLQMRATLAKPFAMYAERF